jgi:ATP-dependent Lhr-like helicase
MSDIDLLSRLHPGLQRHVKEQRWTLSNIQRAAIPVILEGHDCIIEAPTADGKTEAFLFPALTRAAEASEDEGVRVLYIAPLRALLNDIEIRGEAYAKMCNLQAFKWHGDVNQKKKVAQLRTAPHLLLTTPESLEAILLRKAEWPRFLGALMTVIIDEAHNFALGDRGHHLLSLLQRLEAGTGCRPQLIGASATVGNPDKMLRWLSGPGRKPGRTIRVSGTPPKRDYEVRLFDQDAEGKETPPDQLYDRA